MAMELTFTKEEQERIQSITDTYAELLKEAVLLKEKIEEDEKRLNALVDDMGNIKSAERHFFYDLGSKYNMDPSNLQQIAANYVLSLKRK